MGAKGVIVIFVIGVIGIIAMGVLANMITQNPQAESLLKLRDLLKKEYALEEARVKLNAQVFQIALVVDGAGRAQFPPAALPPRFAELPYQVRKELGAALPVEAIEVEFLADSGEDGAPLSKVRIPLDAEDDAIVNELKGLLEQDVKINTRRKDGLGINVKKPVPDEALSRAAKILSRYRYGGWKKIEFNVLGKFHRYDGEGNPLAAEKAK